MKAIITFDRLYQCAKPGCSNPGPYHRHHKANERRFVTAFRWMEHTRDKREAGRYAVLRDRYNAFRPEDTVRICLDHHEEIHTMYGQLEQAAWLRNHWQTPANWTWRAARGLMRQCAKMCEEWLVTETPGLKTRIRVGRSSTPTKELSP